MLKPGNSLRIQVEALHTLAIPVLELGKAGCMHCAACETRLISSGEALLILAYALCSLAKRPTVQVGPLANQLHPRTTWPDHLKVCEKVGNLLCCSKFRKA